MRLLLIHTGGTLMMRGGDPTPLEPDVYTRDLVAELPVLRKLAEIETKILYNLDSADFQPHHWVELAKTVHGSLDRYDGFVIVHGTDTMAYTASALAFLLPGLDRPVILTGAQKPLADVRTDARTNLVDACHLATTRIPEVGIAFHSELLRGCRATKLDAWGMKAFGSPACPPLAELGLGVNHAPHVLAPRPWAPFDGRLEPHVLAVRTFPGLDPRLLHGALAVGVKGMVIEAFGAGNVPRLENSLVPVIEAARAADVPVVIVSQSMRGAVDLTRYHGGVAAARAGAIGAGDMTTEAALTKLMIVLGRAEGVSEGRTSAVRAAFTASWAGEISL
ncbi:asparaginase [Polyangium jinanense]|uniref:Asparaginase n=1 Tax=Polyangium jinanense TaxID=2829994 RepID=A0A9X3WZ03_9BACT|nr:asparaginase [Polyangium jinanense]MDC3954601.1 asparaginase [Polyangium jinanense]MDC3980904.1 asparaginase [Polyangium jinanense]